MPRRDGFQVQFPGWLLTARPRCPDLPRRSLHPWEGTTSPRENEVLIRDEGTGRYMYVSDVYRSQKAMAWTKEERMVYGREGGRVLCDIIDERCALICNPDTAMGKAELQGKLIVFYQFLREIFCFFILGLSPAASRQSLPKHVNYSSIFNFIDGSCTCSMSDAKDLR